TLVCDVRDAAALRERARAQRVNLRDHGAEAGPDGRFGVSFDETTTLADVADLAWVITGYRIDADELDALAGTFPLDGTTLPAALRRTDAVLTHPVFERYHGEAAFV